jgi:hypothetical protein
MTTQMRLRGVTVPHLIAAAISAAPLGYLLYLAVARQLQVSSLMSAAAAVVALLPWLSRGAARASYRAKCDDIAVHVRGEAVPYKTITAVRVESGPRRDLLIIERGQTVRLELVLRDAFAGRLRPLDHLKKKLADVGHPIQGSSTENG